MNGKMVAKYLGFLCLAEAVFLLPSAGVSLLYSEHSALLSLLGTAGLCALLGAALLLFSRKGTGAVYPREAFMVAGGGWVIVSALGALPFFFSGAIPQYIDAFFESASGFTTTGASILSDVEALPRGLMFWRSFTHWLGGIGVLAFILAVVRSKSGSGFSIHILRAESPGPQVDKIMPKMRHSMRYLLLVYGGLSLLNLLFLLAGGMPLFEALCTMFGTAGTGGFGIKNDSMASFSPYLQTVTTVFMLMFGVNFTLYFLLLRGQWRGFVKDQELHLFLGIVLISTAAVSVCLILAGGAPGHSIHHGAFTVSSIISTTGYSTVNFDVWPQLARTILLLLMVSGAMAGSTGGGFKVIRLLILFKSMQAGLYRQLHPRSVKRVQINGKTLDGEVLSRTRLYLIVYCALLLAGILLISVDNLSLETNLSAMLSCFNNIGPGLGAVGPMENFSVFSPFSTFVLTIIMLLGRLEIFPLLMLFFPSTWNSKT